MSFLQQLPFTLPPPAEGQPDVLIIAGEHSGDQHAALMVSGLKQLYPQARIAALGGASLSAAGAQLLFDLTAFSVVGIIEVLKNYSFFKDLFDKVFVWIEKYRPRHICFIDYPGFNLRLAERLFKAGLSRKGGGEIGTLYYISPQVWAWKGKRRFKMARWLDALGVIFPFEVDFFKDVDLAVSFVGHPFVAKGFHLPISYDAKAPVLLLPGSRRIAVTRIFPIMLAAFEQVLKERPEEQALVLYPSTDVHELLKNLMAKKLNLNDKVTLVSDENPIAGKAVLTSSGTMSLACALAGLPGAIVYRAHPLTYLFGRLLVNVPFLGIANLILENPIYPEFIQRRAKAKQLALEIKDSIESKQRINATRQAADQLYAQLSKTEAINAESWLCKHVFKN